MKLFEILNDFLHGKKIRRASWNETLWIEYNAPTEMSRLYIMEEGGLRLIDIDCQFSIRDIQADDWEFYNQ